MVHIMALQDEKIPSSSTTLNSAPSTADIRFARYRVGIPRTSELLGSVIMARSIRVTEAISATDPAIAPQTASLRVTALAPSAV